MRGVDPDSPQFVLARLREREHILAGVIRAQDSWREVLEIIAASEDADDAVDRLRAELDLSQDQAITVVDVQFRRVTRQDRQRILAEQEDIRARVRALETGL